MKYRELAPGDTMSDRQGTWTVIKAVVNGIWMDLTTVNEAGEKRPRSYCADETIMAWKVKKADRSR